MAEQTNKEAMLDIASRLPQPLADVLRSTTRPPEPPSPPPSTADLSPSRHLTFGPQEPSAGGQK
jgi:hypothetical protein